MSNRIKETKLQQNDLVTEQQHTHSFDVVLC